MVLRAGDKILVVHRRLYEGDASRLFLATVEEHEHGIVRARGYSWAWNQLDASYVRKPDERVKIDSVDRFYRVVTATLAELA